jgi:hypothetical protein
MPGVRPDFSDYVVHFTRPIESVYLPPEINAIDTSLGRLARILTDKRIIATKMPWFGAKAVAFTECMWTSLLDHAKRYSSYGIGFTKRFLWDQGGGPALYVRSPDLYDAQADYMDRMVNFERSGQPLRRINPFAQQVASFLTPFASIAQEE